MGREKLEELLARHCAPTFTGIKAGSMIALPGKSLDEYREFFQSYEQCFACKGLKVMELRQQKEHILLLIYRPAVLQRLFRRPLAREILKNSGYREQADLEELLQELKQRMQEAEEFPHEIGLFLGYPPMDVAGFIRCKGKDFRCCGFWKVYGNEKAVQRLFQCYASCIQQLCGALQAGKSLQSMIRYAA